MHVAAFSGIVLAVHFAGPDVVHRFAGRVHAIHRDRQLVAALRINNGGVFVGACRDLRFRLIEFPRAHKGVIGSETKAGRDSGDEQCN